MRLPRSSIIVQVSVLGLAGVIDSAQADVAVTPPFASHMVLQRDMVNPIWGTAASGEQISVTVAGQTQSVVASSDGTWTAELDPMDAGGPFTVTIQGNNTVTLDDVYVGEVWQAAGQSNMDTRLSFYPGLAGEIAAADRPMMRYFTVRQPGNPPTTWEVVSPATAGDLSALAYYFGKEIEQSTGVAVGLVVTAVGGTTIASWLDPATLAANPSITNDDRGAMWDAWVAPVVGYGIRGTIWIQGEQNCNATDAPGYGEVFDLLIDGWRGAWGQGSFPFYFGQLSNIHDLQTDPNNISHVAMVREGQRMALALPSTAMSVNMDIGTAGDWHFPNKPEAGRRMSLPARALVYGESTLVYSGPSYLHATISGGRVTLHFDHVGSGLVSRDGGALTGFAIAGDTGNWVWGNAEIQGDTVVVSSDAVPNPTRVRYAWGDNPILSLYNEEGLPAPSFTTESEDLPASGTGGTGGTGGAPGMGGVSSTGGSPGGAAGAWETGGGGGPGGAVATGGTSGTGGAATTGGASVGGGVPTGGVNAAGGSAPTGGSGFAAAGGAQTTGGMIGTGGLPIASGGMGATATGTGAAGGNLGGAGARGSNSDSGCSCSTVGFRSRLSGPGGLAGGGLIALAIAFGWRRRKAARVQG